jgi:RNA polymerase sigma-70 factor, ECF subfamily
MSGSLSLCLGCLFDVPLRLTWGEAEAAGKADHREKRWLRRPFPGAIIRRGYILSKSNAAASKRDVTLLLRRVSVGDRQAVDRLMELLYRDLHRVAAARMRAERYGQSLQATGLVHEAYLRMARGANGHRPQNRAQFFAIAARTMRQVLVDRAREYKALKRGGQEIRVTFGDDVAKQSPVSIDVLAIDRALTKLEELDERQAKVVELRYFAGASLEEVAESLGLSVGTVKRDWSVASAFLRRELRGSQ